MSVDREHPTDSHEPRTAEGGEETSTDFGDNWFDYCFEQTPERVELQLSETGKDGTTLARFKLGKQPLACQVGELTLARFPLCVARLDYMSQIPDEESAYDRMFLQLLNRKFDGIYLESINPESPLWRYVQTSRLVRRSFFRYTRFDDKAWRGRAGTARIEREDSATDAPNLAIGNCSGRSHRKPT